MDIRENIRVNIIQNRERLGINQTALGEMVNVKKTTVSSWERGQSAPDIVTLYSLCQIFGITLDEMYGVSTTNKEIEGYQKKLSDIKDLLEKR